uniref:ATP synthase subunit a n=1 Tax=Mutela dubia TaxID=152234 RepID=A0A1X9JUT6_9BIVA|nr:ATP synthase F0 subunit 6 [Mutela dubia]AQT38523.1 ATP synthase F0 subunit 6 [Mutela dubia]
MLVDIFSSLDVGVNSNMNMWVLVWLSGFIGLVISLNHCWVNSSLVSHISVDLLSLIYDLVKGSVGKLLGGFALGECTLFLLLFSLNLMGMVPGVFSVTSHLSLTFMLALVVWSCLVISGWVYYWKESAGLLVPAGAPSGLVPLLVLIESVTLLTRPITLGVRLAVNIAMGHLMLHVLGEYVSSFVFSGGLLGWGIGSVFVGGYVVFEFVVSFLQAYVFVLLVSLYSSDHPGGFGH